MQHTLEHLRSTLSISAMLAGVLLVAGCTTSTTNDVVLENSSTDMETVTLYTYDSLSADYGLLPLIIDQFEAEHNATVEVVSFADAGTMLNQLIAERNNPKADVVMGLDNLQLPEIAEYNLLTSYQADDIDSLNEHTQFPDTPAADTLTPFDYGYVAFVYDSEALQFNKPISLQDLTSEEYHDKIVIEQPGLSSPGTQFVAWVNAVLPEEEVETFWQNLKPNVLTVTSDWSTAYYNIFLGEQAPIVLSYLTSPAYHIDQENTDRYKVIPMEEGYVAQVEGVGVVRGADSTSLAEAWVNYVVSEDVQSQIATTQWVFPARNVALPDAYSQLPSAEPSISLQDEQLNAVTTWITKWEQAFSK